MKNFRHLLVLLLLTVCNAVMADDYAYLSIVQTGSQADVSLNDISKITFDESNMVITLSNGSEQKLPLSGLSKMFFTSKGADAIEGVNMNESKFALKDGKLIIEGTEGNQVTIYDTNGRAVRTVSLSKGQTEINVSGLTKGVYIIRAGKEAKKFMNK